jgi:hypothetical protein
MIPLTAGLAWVGLISQAGAQLPTIDEALAISQKTGRPIFALAGNKT